MTLDELTKLVSMNQILSIVDSTKRPLALWSGSVSAGKTVASLFAFLLAVRVAPKDGLIVIVGRSLQTIYQNIFVLFQNTSIFGSKISSQIAYTSGANSAKIFGREVMIVGANNAASVGRIQGATIGLVYVDEAALMPEAFWDMLTTRLRVKGARLLATMNPASSNHWIRKKWILQADAQDLVHFKFTMDDNPHLDPAYVARMHRSYAGVFYDRMIKGEWTNAAGAVYPMWDADRHVIEFDKMPRIARVLSDGIDFAVSHTSAALRVGITAEKKPRLVLMDEWRYDPRDHYGATLAPSDQAVLYRAWTREKHSPHEAQFAPEYTIVDPAAAHFSAELRKFDEMALQTAHNDVLKGVGAISRLLSNDQLLVTDRCKGWNAEITEYRWDPKATAKGEDEVVKDEDDSLDAGRYGIYTPRAYWQYELEAA